MKKIIILFLSILLAACSDGSSVEQTHSTANNISGKAMSVHFIDVGQGDSILIVGPNGKTMLVDGGTKSAGEDVVSYLSNQNIDHLDYVVATHPDADHIGGLISVLNSISINNFIDSGKPHTSATYEEMLYAIHNKNIPYIIPKIGDEIKLDEEVAIKVLQADEHASDNNEASIVLKAEYGEVSFLLMGDADIDMEKKLMAAQNVKATILKAGHHGSNTSSSLPFIQAVNPEAAILSYGQDNSYGHPHAEVINNLKKVNSKIYGTAESGTIVVKTNGNTYQVLADEWTGIGASNSIVQQNTNSTSEVVIDSKNVEDEIVAIKNNGTESVNLMDWQLVSVEGNQIFNFPNITLQPGDTIYITSGPEAKDGNGYIQWTRRQIWLNSGDEARLINPEGEIVSELQ